MNQDINIGAITEALNNKVDLPTNPARGQDQIDYVVDFQVPTAANNYTWYRKYKSGWVEQGGETTSNVSSITFPIIMADTNYVWNVNPYSTDATNFRKYAATLTTSGFINLKNFYGTSSASATGSSWDKNTFWFVKGYAA